MISAEYLAKVLDGKFIEFKEESLIEEIDSTSMVNTIKYLYNLKYLDMKRLKMILKEGAKCNGLLRLKE